MIIYIMDMIKLIKKNLFNKKIILYFFIVIFLLIIDGKLKIESLKKKKGQNYMQICENIAKDIESLKKKYPQLKEFDISKNLNKERCMIDYEYKCKLPTRGTGWVSQVPNPLPDGIWFYICLWDKNDPSENMSQINTQPVMPKWYIKDRRVTYLILEGKKTKNVNNEILAILKKYGLKEQK